MLAATIFHAHITPLGIVWSHWTEHGLYRLEWGQTELNTPDPPANERISSECRGGIDDLESRLQTFFATGGDAFLGVVVDPTGWTPFRRRVYQQCRKIPAGATCTYQQLATMAGSPKASRAVGAAMASNRVPLVIPCHRVVSAGGDLRGFSAPGGLETKRMLLQLELASEAS